MIEKILEMLEVLYSINDKTKRNAYQEKDWEKFDLFTHRNEGVYSAIQIVQEVAKEYGKDTNVRSNGWIPVEVAMPTEEGWYRVTCDNKTYWKTPMVRDLYYYPRIKCFVDNIRRSEHPYVDIKKFDWTEDVTAWKPVEAPYQKGE